MKHLIFDVMNKGRFVRTLSFEFSPMWPLDVDELSEFVTKKIPSLKGEDFKCIPTKIK